MIWYLKSSLIFAQLDSTISERSLAIAYSLRTVNSPLRTLSPSSERYVLLSLYPYISDVDTNTNGHLLYLAPLMTEYISLSIISAITPECFSTPTGPTGEARWRTISNFGKLSQSMSITSASIKVTLWAIGWSAVIALEDRLSITCIDQSSSDHFSMQWVPIKPRPPVISIFFVTLFLHES